MKRVCLVTDELYPFTAGGIGRLLHNLVRDSLRRSEEIEFHFLVPSYLTFEAERVSAYFGSRVHAHYAEMRHGWAPAFELGVEYPPAAAFTDSDWHAQSLDFLRALQHLRAEGLVFEVVEFPDFRGWAFCSLQEKLLGRDFERTTLAVRLHSTDGALQAFEPRRPDALQLARFELERKSLYDAEKVIAHLPAVAAFNSDFYGYSPDWFRKVSVEFPPVSEANLPQEPRTGPRDLLFVTKLQPFKRPEVFLRGATTFFRAHPEYAGRAIFVCHAMDRDYELRVRAMVPPDLAARFVFSLAAPERDKLFAGSIVVIPSAYESLNLSAYEASAAGATLVLNGACIAFGEETPFRDGYNCFKFDGSVEGLAATLARATSQPAPVLVDWTAAPPYWLRQEQASPALTAGATRPLVSVVIPNYNLAAYLPETIASLAASTWENLEVIVVDDASTDPLDGSFLEHLEAGSAPVRVIRNPVNRGLSASRNIGIRAATGKYILPIDADDCIGPKFIEIAVAALEVHSEYDVVVPTAGYFDTDADLSERRFADYAIHLGDVPSLGLIANRLSCATSLLRRSLFDRLQYDETLDSYEDWSLYLRAAHAGSRFLVTSDVQFFYRRRAGSMVHGMTPERHLRLLERIYLSLCRPLPSSAQLFGTLAPTLLLVEEKKDLLQRNLVLAEEKKDLLQRTVVLAEEKNDLLQRLVALARPPGPAPEKPVRYNLADSLNSVVKRVPLVHPLLRVTAERLRSLTGGETSGDRPLRHEMADALNRALKRLPIVHPLLKATGKGITKGSGE